LKRQRVKNDSVDTEGWAPFFSEHRLNQSPVFLSLLRCANIEGATRATSIISNA